MATTILYIPHGGGPLPLLGDPGHGEMIDLLKDLAQKIERPQTIVVISAHWEERVPTITAQANPPLIYDYFGFPPEAYRITYPALGNPELAEALRKALEDGGFTPKLDTRRGFDHGLFVPLTIMYPNADIPCVQLSLVQGLDSETHLRLGKALRSLKNQNLLILGSGFSFHNISEFFNGEDSHHGDPRNDAFQTWLVQTCGSSSLSPAERWERLASWEKAPHARYCHPREEHLLPLHVCYGAAGDEAPQTYQIHVLGKRATAFLWT